MFTKLNYQPLSFHARPNKLVGEKIYFEHGEQNIYRSSSQKKA